MNQNNVWIATGPLLAKVLTNFVQTVYLHHTYPPIFISIIPIHYTKRCLSSGGKCIYIDTRYKYVSSPLGRVVLSRFPHHASSSHEARGFPIDDIMTRTRTSCSNISQELHLTRHFGFRKLLQYFSCNPHHLDTAEPHAAETFPNPDLISMTIVPQLRAAIRIVEITPCSNNH